MGSCRSKAEAMLTDTAVDAVLSIETSMQNVEWVMILMLRSS